MSAKKAVKAPKRRTRLAAEQRRGEIVAVAARLFRAHHYADVSLDVVAEEAGVTRGLINHHFGTKRGLYIEVVRRSLDGNRLPIPHFVHGQSLEERLAKAAKQWVDLLQADKEIFVSSVSPAAGGDPDILAIVEEARDASAARVAAVIGAGPVENLAPRDLARLHVGQAAGEAVVVQWLQHQRLTREEAQQMIFDLLCECARRIIGEPSVA